MLERASQMHSNAGTLEREWNEEKKNLYQALFFLYVNPKAIFNKTKFKVSKLIT